MTTKKERSEYARILGSKGGKAKAKNMTREQRSEAMRRAVQARWRAYRERKRKGEPS